MNFVVVILSMINRFHSSQRAIMLVTLLLGLMQFPASSQVTSTREVDYGKAIEELINLGFPNAKGARYVHVSDENLQYYDRSFSSMMSGETSPKLSGNGFYIPNSDNPKSGKFISSGGTDFVYSEKLDNSRSEEGVIGVSGKLKDADLKKDLEIVQKWALEQSLDSSFSYNGNQYYSAAFSFANLAYQTGLKDEANELIKILFLNHENPEQIIDSLITGIATKEYNTLYTQFTAKPDWEKYHAGLLRIQEKYPRGWDNQPGLSILIPLVKKRVDNEPVPFPSIDGHEFSDEIKKLIEQTAKPPKTDSNEYYGDPGLFLVNKVEKNTNAPAMHQLTQHGMDGFIALVSMIGDDTLVVGNSDSHYSGSNHYSSSYGDDEGKSPEEAYQSLNKPQTRGEVAQKIVSETLPHTYEVLSEMEGDQLKELAIAWWKEHRTDNKFTLIKHYFEQGNQSHISQLAMTLIDENTEESRKLFEDTVSNSDRPEQLANLVQIYVKKRRAKAKDFLVNYEKILLAKFGELTDKESNYTAYQISEAGGTRKFIAAIMLFTEELKPEVLFENLAKKGTDTKSIMEMLGTVYDDNELPKVMSKFIHVAAQTDETKKRDAILEALYNRIFYGDEALQVDGFSAPVIEAKTFSFSDEEKADWLKLLALEGGQDAYANANVIGMLLDKSLHPNRNYGDYQIMWSLGNDVVKEVIKARALAFLEGKQAEPLPNMNSVPEDKKEKILEELEEVSAVKFREMYAALNYSERLLVLNDPNSRSKFAEANTYLKGIDVKHPSPEDKIANEDQLKEVLKPMLEKKVGAETYAELANIIIKNSTLFEGVAVSPQVGGMLPGRDISLTRSSMFYYPALDIAMADILAGKREDFVVMVATVDMRSRRAIGQEPQIFILDKGTPAEPKKLEEITENHTVTVTPVTKKIIEDWKKNQVDGKEQIVNELIQIQPSLQDMRARLLEMELEDLEAALEEMKGNQ